MSMEPHECSLNEQHYLLYTVFCGRYPPELSNDQISYEEVLTSRAGNLNIARWSKIIYKHTKIHLRDLDEGIEQSVNSSCLAFKNVCQILSSHMVSCTLGLSSFQEWLEFRGNDNNEYNEARHKSAAVYFIKAVNHILRGKFFGDMDNIRNHVRIAKFKNREGKDVTQEINVVSKRGEKITGCSYDCLTCSDTRHKPITAIVEEAYKAVISNSKKEDKDESAFLDSVIGQELMGPWLAILEKHQSCLWEKLRGLVGHSTYIYEYFSETNSIDRKGLDQYGTWGGMRTIALFSKEEWMLKLNGESIKRNVPGLINLIKETSIKLKNMSKKQKVKNDMPKRKRQQKMSKKC